MYKAPKPASGLFAAAMMLSLPSQRRAYAPRHRTAARLSWIRTSSRQVPVYRVYTNRADANHRYTTDRATRDAKGMDR